MDKPNELIHGPAKLSPFKGCHHHISPDTRIWLSTIGSSLQPLDLWQERVEGGALL